MHCGTLREIQQAGVATILLTQLEHFHVYTLMNYKTIQLNIDKDERLNFHFNLQQIRLKNGMEVYHSAQC